MSIAVPTNQIINLQQIEATVSGPDGANRLYIVTGQIPMDCQIITPQNSWKDETYTTLIGPVFSRREFIRATCSAALSGTTFWPQPAVQQVSWKITDSNAVWDDDAGQVKLIVGVNLSFVGTNGSAALNSVSFNAAILAEVSGN